MTHKSGHIIINSVLDLFDAEEYEGVREHFSEGELARIDEFRAMPDTHVFTWWEKQFISRMLRKAVFAADA